MTTLAGRVAPRLLPLLVLLLSPPAAADCPFGITPQTAQRLFDRVTRVPVGAGYRFEGMSAKGSELVVLWSRDGQACPTIEVHLTDCSTGLPTLQLRVPPELPHQCPGLQAVVQALSSAVVAEPLLGPDQAVVSSPTARLTAVALLGLGLALLIRRILAATPWAGVGWADVGVLAFAAALAAPFFVDAPRAVMLELGAAWIAFTAWLVDPDLLATRTCTATLSLLGLFFLSLLVHWWLSSAGPGDLSLNLAAIWSPGLELRLGPAPIALFRLLALALPRLQDTHIIWCNLLLSSIVPLLLYGIVVEFGMRSTAALFAATVVAVHPLLIVFSGVLERQPIYLFAAAGSLLALIGFLKRGRRSRFLVFILGALLAVTSRPEGAHVLVLYVAALLLPASRRARTAVALALVFLFTFAFVYVHQVLHSKLPGGNSFIGEAPFLWTVLFDGHFTPLGWTLAWLLGLVFGLWRRTAWIVLLVVLALDVTWRWTGLYFMFVGHVRQVASARYETILLIPFALGIALFFQAVLETRTLWKVGFIATFVALSAVTFRRPYETLLVPFTVDDEYRFLRHQALTLPPQSRLYVLDPPVDDIGLVDAHMVGRFVGSSVAFSKWSERRCDDMTSASAPAYLYVGSSCAELIDTRDRPLPSPEYARWLQLCTAMRTTLASDVVAQTEVRARKMAYHDFKDPTVHLGVYRLRDPSLCSVDARLPSPP